MVIFQHTNMKQCQVWVESLSQKQLGIKSNTPVYMYCYSCTDSFRQFLLQKIPVSSIDIADIQVACGG